MAVLSDLMTPDPITLHPDDTVMDNLSIFEDNHVHHIPVVAEDDEVVGMISSRDFDNYLNILNVISNNGAPVRIKDIMTKPAFSYYEDVDVHHAAQAMVDNNIHAIVIVNRADAMVGIVTSTDLLRFLAEKK